MNDVTKETEFLYKAYSRKDLLLVLQKNRFESKELIERANELDVRIKNLETHLKGAVNDRDYYAREKKRLDDLYYIMEKENNSLKATIKKGEKDLKNLKVILTTLGK